MSSGSSSTMPAEPLRVLALLPDLGGGGAQQVMLRVLRDLPRERFVPELAVVRAEGPLRDAVPSDVPLHDLAARSVRWAGPALRRLIRQQRPHVVFSTIYHTNLLVLLLRPFLPEGTRVVVREATLLGPAVETGVIPGRLAWLHRALYRTADVVVAQCDAMARDLVGLGIPEQRVVTVLNPLDVDRLAAEAASAKSPFVGRGPGPHIVAAGRLVHQKGFDRLLRAVPELRRKRSSAQVWILGDDPGGRDSAAEELRSLQVSLGLEDCVHFVGYRSDVVAWLAHADLFVLSSRYEGLPNVLLEALACGCSVVALEGEGGTREVLERCGRGKRMVAELTWPEAWFFRAASFGADLDCFRAERILEDYARVLAGERPEAPSS